MERQRTANIRAISPNLVHIDPVWGSVAAHLGLPAHEAAIARQPWRFLNHFAQGRIAPKGNTVEPSVSRSGVIRPRARTPNLSLVA